MRLRQVAGRLGVAALDLLLPPQCAACDAVVGAPGQLCARCFGQANFIAEPCCATCGAPVDTAVSGAVCLDCATRPPPWRAARAAFRYDALARRLILPLKYGDRTDLAAALAGPMARAGRKMLDGADLLVPVPLHRSRLHARRYNQAALLACAVGRIAGRPVLVDALRRLRATTTLVEKGPAAREAELAGAIAAEPRHLSRIAGAHVVLIDDVLTTGATARGCAAALQGAGAASVDLLVAARTLREDGEEWDDS